MQAKADLHVHSKYSNRPSEWILRRMGAPECFVEPRELYRRAREKGMDFVTISDHNTIAGALEIADLPNTFLSAELTTYFPDNNCKIHVLVHDVTEKQFEEANSARENIYDLQAYLRQADVLHTVAHPLFAVNDKLTVDYVEKLLLMFERFEVLNGTRHARSNRLAEVLMNGLTPAAIEMLSDKHGIEPVGDAPHRKMMTGGSDDHSGVYIASAHTVTPAAATVADFVSHLRRGAHRHGGSAGTSLRLAHSFYHIGYSYYRNRFLGDSKGGSKLLEALLRQMASSPAPSKASGVKGALGGFVAKVVRRWKTKRLNPLERTLVEEFSSLFEGADASADEKDAVFQANSDEYTFDLACRITHRIGYHFLDHFTAHIKNVSLLESLQTVSSLGPIALSITPYLAAFRTQHKDEELLREFTARFNISDALSLPNPRKAWVTDTYDDINGVAKTIRVLARTAEENKRNLTVVTCLENAPKPEGFKVVNFTPVGMFDVPEYSQQRVAFPPFLNVVEYLEREQFEEVIISTPGPLGLTALAAARLLGLKVTGIYHTDFPQYVEILTEDETLKQLTWRYMGWFYGQMDKILAPSQCYKRNLVESGLDAARIKVLPRGVDTVMFSPEKRVQDYWHRHNCNGAFKFLYVGRISKEKNVDILVKAFDKLNEKGNNPAYLVLVGDGPLLPELRKRCARNKNIIFTGILHDEDLAQAYASSDVFVFPSTTDTFGNVVLEAQASGLPTIVSNIGGPSEIVQSNESGLAVDVSSPMAFTEAMEKLQSDDELRAQFRERALRNAQESQWPAILDVLWK